MLGKLGKSYPATYGQDAKNNNGPTAQASVTGDRFGWIVALVFAILALVLAVIMVLTVRSMSNDLENVRGLIENSAAAASSSAISSALAAERADKAERSAAISREYAVQVYPQLNRLGYPILSPGEEGHPIAQPEDYERLDKFAEIQK